MMYTSVSEDQWKNDNSHNAYIHTIQVCIQCVPVVGTHRIIYTLLYYTYICDALSGGTGIFMDFFIPIVCLLSCTLHKTAAACLILLSCDYRCGIPVTWFSARMSPITIYPNPIYNLRASTTCTRSRLRSDRLYNIMNFFSFISWIHREGSVHKTKRYYSTLPRPHGKLCNSLSQSQ